MFDLFDFTPSYTDYNWNMLKKIGKVTENKVKNEDTGEVTITRTFTSSSGAFTIESSESYFEKTNKEEEYYILKSKLDKAISEQRFEDAIKLRDEINTYKKNFLEKDDEKKESKSN